MSPPHPRPHSGAHFGLHISLAQHLVRVHGLHLWPTRSEKRVSPAASRARAEAHAPVHGPPPHLELVLGVLIAQRELALALDLLVDGAVQCDWCGVGGVGGSGLSSCCLSFLFFFIPLSSRSTHS